MNGGGVAILRGESKCFAVLQQLFFSRACFFEATPTDSKVPLTMHEEEFDDQIVEVTKKHFGIIHTLFTIHLYFIS